VAQHTRTMSMRKNVSLPDRYEEYYEQLEESGVFEEEFGGFSQFVQAMIETLAEDKPRILYDHIKTKEQKWRKKRQKLEEQYDLGHDSREIEEQKVKFFENMLQVLQRVRDRDEELEKVYQKLEEPWIKKYRKQFHHVNKKSFRNELESVLENKELADQFNDWLSMRDISHSRQYRYLISLKKIIEHNNFSLLNLEENQEGEEKIKQILLQIQRSDYKQGDGDYSPKTQAEYKMLVKRLLEFHDIKPDPEHTSLLPQGFTAYVKEKDRNRTDPSDLPTPSDVKKLARKLESLSTGVNKVKNPAILLANWDCATRIGELLNVKVGDVKVNGKTVTLTIPGNKESPDRDVPCVVAAPIIKHWLENCHPEPDNPENFLFCNTKFGKPGKPANYRYFTEKLKKAGKQTDIDCKLKGEANHIFRKGRITYLKKADIMNESMIDRRVGHVQGSQETRTYTRIGDDEAGDAYLSGYGMEQEGRSRVETDVKPLTCSNCQLVNSGHRLSCRSCGDPLNPENYLEGVDQVESTVSKDVKKKAGRLRQRIISNETEFTDSKIDEQAKKLVAEEKGLDPEEIEWE
ncbi:MAG: tyrosine-type recombinase/integrase, partial [Candidatus Nanohaloarchaea archaeon]